MIGQMISVVGLSALTLGVAIGYFWGQGHIKRKLKRIAQAFERNLKAIESQNLEEGGVK